MIQGVSGNSGYSLPNSSSLLLRLEEEFKKDQKKVDALEANLKELGYALGELAQKILAMARSGIAPNPNMVKELDLLLDKVLHEDQEIQTQIKGVFNQMETISNAVASAKGGLTPAQIQELHSIEKSVQMEEKKNLEQMEKEQKALQTTIKSLKEMLQDLFETCTD